MTTEEKVIAGLKAKLAAMILTPLSDATLERAYQEGRADRDLVHGALIYANALFEKATWTSKELKEPSPMLSRYPVSELSISAQVANVFSRNSIVYLGQLAFLTKEEVSRWRRIGPKAVREIEELMADHGLTFKAEPS